MKAIKKRIPLSILQAVSDILRKEEKYITIRDNEKYMLSIGDADSSDVYFTATLPSQNGCLLYLKPADANNSGPWSGGVKVDDIPGRLSKWIDNLKSYEEINTIFDDPIQKKYEDFYYSEFSIVDEDAEYAPFDIPKQFLIANHIHAVKDFLITNKDSFKDDQLFESLQNECEILIEELPHTTKNNVIRRMAHLWATVSKSGMSLMKKFLKEFGSEVTKQIAQTSAESISDFVKNISESLGN